MILCPLWRCRPGIRGSCEEKHGSPCATIRAGIQPVLGPAKVSVSRSVLICDSVRIFHFIIRPRLPRPTQPGRPGGSPGGSGPNPQAAAGSYAKKPFNRFWPTFHAVRAPRSGKQRKLGGVPESHWGSRPSRRESPSHQPLPPAGLVQPLFETLSFRSPANPGWREFAGGQARGRRSRPCSTGGPCPCTAMAEAIDAPSHAGNSPCPQFRPGVGFLPSTFHPAPRRAPAPRRRSAGDCAVSGQVGRLGPRRARVKYSTTNYI